MRRYLGRLAIVAVMGIGVPLVALNVMGTSNGCPGEGRTIHARADAHMAKVQNLTPAQIAATPAVQTEHDTLMADFKDWQRRCQ